MTGTGTQADPYIPTTLTEFITAVGSSGAYVTLTQDINAADDPEYTGELTEMVVVDAALVDGANHSVDGVTVRASTMLYLQNHGCTVQNTHLRNWGFKQSAAGAMLAGRSGSTETIKGCTVSISLTFFASNQKLINHVDFDGCGIDITVSNGGGGNIMENVKFTRTTAFIHGIGASSGFYIIEMERSALIIDAGEQTGDKFSSLTARYSYVAFLKRSESAIAFGRTGMSTIGCVLAVADGQQTSYVPSGTTVGTLSQMTNKDWLTSVGFLP